MAQEHSNCWDRKQLWAILVEKLIVTTTDYVHAQTSWDLAGGVDWGGPSLPNHLV